MSTMSGVHFSLTLDAAVGPASRISRTRAANIVAHIMNHESSLEIHRRPRVHPWRKVALMTAAAVVLPVTMVAAGARLATSGRAASAWALLVSGPPPSAPIESRRVVPRGEEAVLAPPPVAPAVEMLAPAVRPAVPAAESHHSRPAAPRLPSVGPQTPQDMLQMANDLRAKHQWFAATQLYEQTIRTFPNRAEAYSATVAAGVLRLDQLGDARDALDLFSSAVRARPHGALSEEARWGVVQSHRALGDAASEKARLQEFVALYPQSLFASRAYARLRDLGGALPPTL